ncbi:MAG: hypothetical protein M1825_004627 [Sarcosagium campestre]|nr:MAG: hypothetical protein M1825_004627 [Sarcosagium campestre]
MAPSIRYFNQSAPFWDFIASFEDQAFRDPNREDTASSATAQDTSENEKKDGEAAEKSEKPSETQEHPFRPRCGGPRGKRGHCGGRGAPGGWGRGGFPGGFPGAFHGAGGPHAGGPFGAFLNTAFNPGQAEEEGDYRPAVDVFTTQSSYHVHVSLPGAKKDDVGLDWNADKSELSIGGVIYRPGDEDFLNTLAMGERKVGAFKRKVRLGNERNPAEVDADAITAKLEDGVLRVELPKVEKDYVDVKKVDIE